MAGHEDLERLYREYGQLNHTMHALCFYVRKGNYSAARSEYAHDGDKIPGYDPKGAEFRAVLESIIGCRIHGRVNCQGVFCRRQ